MQLGVAQLEFLSRLGRSPEGLQLLGLIDAEIASCNVELRKLTGESLYRAQGRALWLDEFKQRLSHDATAQVLKRTTNPFAGDLR